MPARSGGRRPVRSDIGPTTPCPSARPMKKTASVACTAPALAPRSLAIAGKAGRYMSMERGAKAISDPRITMKCTRTPEEVELCISYPSPPPSSRSPYRQKSRSMKERLLPEQATLDVARSDFLVALPILIADGAAEHLAARHAR